MVPIVGGELPNRLTDELNGGAAYRSVFGGVTEGVSREANASLLGGRHRTLAT